MFIRNYNTSSIFFQTSSTIVSDMIPPQQIRQVQRIATDYIYPFISGSIVHYSNMKGHPFEVQFVMQWITNSIFAESKAKFLCSALSMTFVGVFWKEFIRDMRRMDLAWALEGKQITWMRCLNTAGSLYLSMTWMYNMLALIMSRLRTRNCERAIKTTLGFAYVVTALVLLRRYRGQSPYLTPLSVPLAIMP